MEEAAGVGGDGFEVAALGFSVEGSEGERGFAGAGDAGEDDKGVARDVDVNVFQVVLARAADADVGRRAGVPRVAEAEGVVERGEIHACFWMRAV